MVRFWVDDGDWGEGGSGREYSGTGRYGICPYTTADEWRGIEGFFVLAHEKT